MVRKFEFQVGNFAFLHLYLCTIFSIAMEQRPVNEEISHNSISLFKKEIGEKAKDKLVFYNI